MGFLGSTRGITPDLDGRKAGALATTVAVFIASAVPVISQDKPFPEPNQQLQPLKDQFNADIGKVRILTIGDPTYPTCRHGCLGHPGERGSKFMTDKLAVYVVWVPLLNLQDAATLQRVEGRERLRILARVMRPATLSLLHRAGIRLEMACLDVGCGGGDVSFDLARLVGPSGRVLGMDVDVFKLEIARSEAATQQFANIEFRLADITESEPEAKFDLAHARFLLSHLPNPAEALANIRNTIRPGGIIVVPDTDFRGYFCDPDCPALWR